MSGLAPPIVLLYPSRREGGVQTLVASIGNGLAARGFEVGAICWDDGSGEASWISGQLRCVTGSANFKPHDQPKSLTDALRFARELRHARPDIVFLHSGSHRLNWKDALSCLLAGVRRRYAMVHHVDELSPRHALSTRLASKAFHRLVVTTPVARDILVAAGVSARKVTVIPPCTSAHDMRTGCREAARAQLGIPDDAFVVSCVTRLEENKRVGDLVDAVSGGLLGRNESLHLIVAGTGPCLEQLRASVREDVRSRVHILGFVEEVGPVYSAADVFALPSVSEGFGLVFIEAAAWGVPSIGANVGGVPYAIKHGETGLLIPPGDVEALAEAIHRLWASPSFRERLGEAARQRVEVEFGETKMIGRYEQLFRRGDVSEEVVNAPAEFPGVSM